MSETQQPEPFENEENDEAAALVGEQAGGSASDAGSNTGNGATAAGIGDHSTESLGATETSDDPVIDEDPDI